MNTAVVTGAAGFIGSHTVELLLNKGFRVVACDNLVNGQKEHVELFKNNKNFTFHHVDLALPFDESIFKDATYVFHLAALADIVPSMEDPLKYHQANVDATVRVLEAARRQSATTLKKLVFAASSSCYGIPDEVPTSENADVRPMYPYSFTKYIAEQTVLFWGNVYKLPVISLRYFNVYGPRARSNNTYGAVFKVFLSQKLHGKPLTIVGDGSQTRDFIFVTDVARANLAAAQAPVTGEVLNIGTGKPQSITYLTKLIGGPVVHVPKRPGEPDVTYADISKAEKLLEWRPQVSFEEGVKVMLDTIDYWRNTPVWDPASIQEATATWFRYLGNSKKGTRGYE